ncbi:tyrosine-type recombinase/integrase [Gilvibacter sediminis]|uniref:tyrosine-type recombinase/integrase n=1 Tax=Gilvibacter sediminis TaxID=379071 RepID=UPI00234FEDAF|nr:tyrosine-type recombinase/integrase [Gilvibacter sediminis]MDC7997697.1 tyrosine-type recombinase/integrase [Gilvibacter sediminis]
MKVTLKPIIHQGRTCMAIQFVYAYTLKQYIKEFPGVYWSSEKRCFYLFYLETRIEAFKQYMLTGGYTVSVYQIKNVERRSKSVKIIQKGLSIEKTEVHRQFIDFLGGRRYSKNTIAVYGGFILDFLRHSGDTDTTELGVEDVREYLEWTVKHLKYSISTHRQAVSALKLFAYFYPECSIDGEEIPMPKKDKKLPVVLSPQEVMTLLQVTKNLKHRAALAMLYGSGLRIGELLNLKLSNFDFDRRLLHVRNSKGRKDRYASIAESCIPLLQSYYMAFQPQVYFIENPKGGQYNPNSVRRFLKISCERAGITKRVTPHTLRHSYATHLLENGTDIRYIQELLGHSRPETTMVYTHVQRKDLQSIRSPLDQMLMDAKNTPPEIAPKKNVLIWPGFGI